MRVVVAVVMVEAIILCDWEKLIRSFGGEVQVLQYPGKGFWKRANSYAFLKRAGAGRGCVASSEPP